MLKVKKCRYFLFGISSFCKSKNILSGSRVEKLFLQFFLKNSLKLALILERTSNKTYGLKNRSSIFAMKPKKVFLIIIFHFWRNNANSYHKRNDFNFSINSMCWSSNWINCSRSADNLVDVFHMKLRWVDPDFWNDNFTETGRSYKVLCEIEDENTGHVSLL